LFELSLNIHQIQRFLILLIMGFGLIPVPQHNLSGGGRCNT
jgi:hypothetical protein